MITLIKQLSILVFLAATAAGQNAAVTKNSTTNAVNGNLTISANRTFTVNGTLTTSATSVGFNTTNPLTWAGVTAQTSVQAAASKHGLLVRAPVGTANAIIGWSSSGAVAGKFYQDTSYTAPAVFIGRAATSATIPTFEIGAATGNATHTAIQLTNIGASTPAFSVYHNGAIVNASSVPSTIGGVGLSSGQVSAASVTSTIGNISAIGTISGSNLPSTARIEIGTGAPSSTPGNGTIYINTAGNATTTLWIRAAGAWVAK